MFLFTLFLPLSFLPIWYHHLLLSPLHLILHVLLLVFAVSSLSISLRNSWTSPPHTHVRSDLYPSLSPFILLFLSHPVLSLHPGSPPHPSSISLSLLGCPRSPLCDIDPQCWFTPPSTPPTNPHTHIHMLVLSVWQWCKWDVKRVIHKQ